jgi:hypothetical protein
LYYFKIIISTFFSDFVNIIHLPINSAPINKGQELTVAGWGVVYQNALGKAI